MEDANLLNPQIRKPGLIISASLEIFAALFFVIGFGSPYWAISSKPPHRFGIWQACTDGASGSVCTDFSKIPEFENAWKSSNTYDNMSFVTTNQVFCTLALLFLAFSMASYFGCFYNYNDWFVAMACAFQFFTGIVSIISCMVWSPESLRFSEAHSWAFVLFLTSGCIFAINGMVYAVLVCTGMCYVTRNSLGIVLRGSAEFTNAANQKKKPV